MFMLLTLVSGLFLSDLVLSLHCHDVTFNVTASALNRVANNPPKDLFSDPDAITAFLNQPVAYQNVSGTFSIFGQFCSPLKFAAKQKLQVLVHGNTYNHTYWSALQKPESSNYAERSWIRYATSRGYHTLALDTLGSGLSSHPDPVNIVQDPLQTEVLHHVISKYRFFPTVVLVGHSYGSGLALHLTETHPDDFDGLVLTGFGMAEGDATTGVTYARFDEVPGKPGYLKSTNKTGRRDYFFYGDYDLAEVDWNGQGTIGISEYLSGGESLNALPVTFQKPVFVAAGNEDVIFCSELGVQPANCSAGDEIPSAREYFSLNAPFDWFLQPESGHVLQLQKTAPLGYAKVFTFLSSVGL
jgi:pimeloyl-ACP methyl ester carboxylesterase